VADPRLDVRAGRRARPPRRPRDPRGTDATGARGAPQGLACRRSGRWQGSPHARAGCASVAQGLLAGPRVSVRVSRGLSARHRERSCGAGAHRGAREARRGRRTRGPRLSSTVCSLPPAPQWGAECPAPGNASRRSLRLLGDAGTAGIGGTGKASGPCHREPIVTQAGESRATEVKARPPPLRHAVHAQGSAPWPATLWRSSAQRAAGPTVGCTRGRSARRPPRPRGAPRARRPEPTPRTTPETVAAARRPR